MQRLKQRATLTTPDLVLLSLLAERPMHGYQANLLLEQRQVRDWAGISRPQVYYSLEKLLRAGLLREVEGHEAVAGPERRVVATTAKGRAALADALDREGWTTQRERPSFLTWMALSWQAREGVVRRQIQRRRRFLESELAREETTLQDVMQEVGHKNHEAVWMLQLLTRQFKTELAWLDRVEAELPHRAPARRPVYVSGSAR
jgi:DNA-binding PadR family transcriptional regulator